MEIRDASIEDAAQIAGIYNHYVLNSHATFEIDAVGIGEIERRVSEIASSYPFLVFSAQGKILGYAHAGLYKTRAAYRNSVEISVYIRHDENGKGIGTRLYEILFARLAESDVHAIIAGISLPNDASVRLHERFGMRKVAHFEEVGFKFGRWIDVGYWELINR